jgi:energy-coupling factor transporter ATP-binding protein EcfA2
MKDRKLKEDLQHLASLRSEVGQSDQLEELGHDFEAQEARVASAAVVCLVGPTGAGKSTLLNALAGSEIAIAGADRPTTTVPVIYAPRGADTSRFDAFPEATCHRYDTDSTLPWSGQILIDAPDVNSVRADHRELVRRLALEADVLVVVLHHQGVVEESTTSFVDLWQDRRRLAVVLNRADEMTDEVRASLLKQTSQMATERWGVNPAAIFCVSALEAQRDGGQDDGFEQFVSWLGGLLEQDTVAGIRRGNLEGTRRQLAVRASSALVASQASFDALDLALDEAFSSLGERAVGDATRRLRARRGDLELTLASEMAKRWRGPGGWLLKFGTWGPISAVGALAVRRNPLAAGALAVGGQAADRLRSSLAGYRLERGSGLAPAEAELQAWLAESFRQARVEADAISQPSTQQVLAAQAAAAEALSEGVDQVWDDVVSLDLPEFAESRWFRLSHLPLDLPLYGLGLDVGYRTVFGYLSGAWLPLDYYVNAGALAVVTAATVYLLSRWLVAGGARILERRSTAKIRAKVFANLEEVAAGAKSAVLAPRLSLQRLVSDESVRG